MFSRKNNPFFSKKKGHIGLVNGVRFMTPRRPEHAVHCFAYPRMVGSRTAETGFCSEMSSESMCDQVFNTCSPNCTICLQFLNMQNGRHLKAYLLAKHLLYPKSISQGFSIQGNVWGGSLTLRASCLTRNNFCFAGDVGFWTKPRVHTGC